MMYYPPKYGEDEAKKIGGNFDDILEWTLRQNSIEGVDAGMAAMSYLGYERSIAIPRVKTGFEMISDRFRQGWNLRVESDSTEKYSREEVESYFWLDFYRSWSIFVERRGGGMETYEQLRPNKTYGNAAMKWYENLALRFMENKDGT
jgi:hypothetical protein